MLLTVEKACYDDLAGIAALYQELLGTPQSLSNIQRHFSQINENPMYRVLVAKDENKTVLGTVMCVICNSWTEGCRPFLVVENVVVSKQVRGLGIGKQLFEAVDQFALEHRCSYSLLVSSAFRKSAHQFYHAIGYTDAVKGFRKCYIDLKSDSDSLSVE
jgi:GNAT superfamily N-acetyltransferase